MQIDSVRKSRLKLKSQVDFLDKSSFDTPVFNLETNYFPELVFCSQVLKNCCGASGHHKDPLIHVPLKAESVFHFSGIIKTVTREGAGETAQWARTFVSQT